MMHILQTVAWTLIHFCWQATAIAATYFLVSLAAARHSSSTRYLVALGALLLMLVSSVLTFAWEMRGTNSPVSFSTSVTGIERTLAERRFTSATAPGGFRPEAGISLSVSNLLPWIDGLWVLGVVALSLRGIGGWLLIQRMRSSASERAPASVRASFQRISNALGLRRPVLLRVSSAIAGPITVGALRALVLLPLSAATALSPEELEVVLAHELAHVRRADFFWNLLQTLAETLFFFHPAVWWISARMRHERELCCDDLALQVCPNPVVYAHALFRLEEQRSRQLHLAMALDGHQSPRTLRMRIGRILGEPTARNLRRPVSPIPVVAACAALVVLLLPVPQLVASLNPTAHGAAAHSFANNRSSEARPVLASISKRLAVPLPHALLLQSAAAQAESTPNPESAEVATSESAEPQEKADEPTTPNGSYIDRMKAEGYDVDLDKYIAMKVQNVTPEYARAMSQLGFGKPTADDLIACKIQGVTPEAIAKFKQDGTEVKSFQDAISYRIFQVTPEFVAGMKAAGFSGLDSDQLLAMRIQNVTPEYAREIKQQFPDAKAEDLVKCRIFHIDAAFIALAKKHGFTNLSLEKLVQLRISHLLDDESK